MGMEGRGSGARARLKRNMYSLGIAEQAERDERRETGKTGMIRDRVVMETATFWHMIAPIIRESTELGFLLLYPLLCASSAMSFFVPWYLVGR